MRQRPVPSRPTPLPRPELRRRLRRARRSPVAWWAALALVGALAWLRAGAAAGAVDDQLRAWGEPVHVAVATHDLAAGDVVGDDDVRLERRPAAMLPDGAVVDDVPTGRTVTAPVVAGEAIVDRRLAPGGLSGAAALLPPGHRAVAVPTSGGGFGTDAPPLAVGDRVDVLATFDVGDGDDDPTGVVVAAAEVIDISETSVTVAVPGADAARVAFAAARGTITLALVGAS